MKHKEITINIKMQEEFEDTKGYSESVIRRTDNTMDRRKGTNNDLQNIIYKGTG
jgi:hypothetical protein